MLNPNTAVLVVVDVQGKLARQMVGCDDLFDRIGRMIRGCRTLDVPIVWAEQYPKGLGPTVPEVARHLEGLAPIEKNAFSCWGDAGFRAALEATGRRQVLVCGIETHICVYQTVRDLLEDGYDVEVVVDCVSSRTDASKAIGLERVRHAGARSTNVEMALYEMLGKAGGERFKKILEIVK
jgi:nicotinamidase-related amidase